MSILAIVLFFNGCASKHMRAVNLSETDMKLAQDEAAIVFFRPTILGDAIQAPIAESMDNDLKFVAIVSAKSKVFYKTTPGKHFL
jgi:PBP1b-binding outer membrane lipoprotein LpoB